MTTPAGHPKRSGSSPRPPGALPKRYDEYFRKRFFDRFASVAAPNMTILDIGGGRSPTIVPADRPLGAEYIGLDPVSAELELAASAYDRVKVGHAEHLEPDLVGTIDLVVSWNTFEHVMSLSEVIRNVHAYLKPGGWLLAQFAGRYSAHALLNRVLPARFSRTLMERLLGRPPDTVFEARYDQCHPTALRRELRPFRNVTIYPHYRDAVYFEFSRLAQAVFILYEDVTRRLPTDALASHYLVSAQRPAGPDSTGLAASMYSDAGLYPLPQATDLAHKSSVLRD